MSESLDKEYGVEIHPKTEQAAAKLLQEDLLEVGITERELGWLRNDRRAWSTTIEYIRAACVQARPATETLPELSAKNVYELTKEIRKRGGNWSMKAIALEIGLPEKRFLHYFGRSTQKPLRAAYELARKDCDWPEDFDDIVGSIVIDALIASSYDFDALLNGLHREIRGIGFTDAKLAQELMAERDNIESRVGKNRMIWEDEEREIRKTLEQLARRVHEFNKKAAGKTIQNEDEKRPTHAKAPDDQLKQLIQQPSRNLTLQQQRLVRLSKLPGSGAHRSEIDELSGRSGDLVDYAEELRGEIRRGGKAPPDKVKDFEEKIRQLTNAIDGLAKKI